MAAGNMAKIFWRAVAATVSVTLGCGCASRVSSRDAAVDAAPANDGTTNGGPPLDEDGDTTLDAASASVDSELAADGGDGGEAAADASGCTPDPGICPALGVVNCTGWDCAAAWLPTLAGQPCKASGEPSMVAGDTAYACGPDWVAGYIGDPAGNGCVQFAGTRCGEYGSPSLDDAGQFESEYVCPLDGGPPAESACIQTTNDPNDTGWCCNTSSTCDGGPACQP
jgi:hypothetical protein